ncbi:MAG: AraC family transcriptional regulator ligand-binding domain-containing protein [Pseudomonadales bacterium]
MGDQVSTSYAGTLKGLVETLQNLGLDADAILEEAGVDLQSTSEYDARISLETISSIVARVSSSKLGPIFGLKYAESVHATTYHSFGIMLISSTSLRKFCERLERYYAYINTTEQTAFTVNGNQAELSYTTVVDFKNNEEALAQISGWAATWLKLIRMAYQPEYAPLRVTFHCDSPNDELDEFKQHFNCPLEFKAADNKIVFPVADLDLPFPGGNAELARRSECMVFDYLKNLGRVDTVNAVRITLFDLLPTGRFALADVAAVMAVEEAQLSHTLKMSNSSYQSILNETRRELAEEYISRADITVGEVAYMLGFSDCSNFARSFRRWTGKSPSEFRAVL